MAPTYRARPLASPLALCCLLLLWGSLLCLLAGCEAARPRSTQVATATAPTQQPDRDGDGVPDHFDQQPRPPASTAPPPGGYPLDSDGDGVADALDRCPDSPGRAANDGCPGAKAAPHRPPAALAWRGAPGEHRPLPKKVLQRDTYELAVDSPGLPRVKLYSKLSAKTRAAHAYLRPWAKATTSGEKLLEDYQKPGLLAARIPATMGMDSASTVTLAIIENSEGAAATPTKRRQLVLLVGTDTTDLVIKSLPVTEHMSAALVDPDKAFTFEPEGTVTRRYINNRHPREFTWNVKPVAAGVHWLKIQVKYIVPDEAHPAAGLAQEAIVFKQKVTVPWSLRAFVVQLVDYCEAHWKVVGALLGAVGTALLGWFKRLDLLAFLMRRAKDQPVVARNS